MYSRSVARVNLTFIMSLGASRNAIELVGGWFCLIRKLRVSSGVQGFTGFIRDIFLAIPLVVEIRTATFIFGRIANGEWRMPPMFDI